MKLARRLLLRTILAAALLILAAGLILPRLNADRFGQRVKASLEEALGRQVEIGKVRLDLFNGPGFSVDTVVIHDDPAVSLEPFAYVETLEARISFLSIWAGRLRFSSLRLSSPSINLTRRESGPWNFVHLLERSHAAHAATSSFGLPAIQIRDGRINLKLGTMKSVFYLSDARVDITPPDSSGGEWRVRFEGAPARNDHPTRSFGQFTARGRWRPGGPIDASVELEPSSLSDLVRLVHGHDVGVHGLVALRLRLTGPPTSVSVNGRAELSDVHRWDLLAPHTGAWPLDVAGTLDLPAQNLVVHSATSEGAPLPIALEFRLTNYLRQPRWAALVRLDHFPAAPLPEVARHMGLPLPAEVALAGTLTGGVGYSPETGVQGAITGEQLAVTLPDSPPVSVDRAQVQLTGGTARLERTAFTSAGASAAIQADYDWRRRALRASIVSSGMPLSEPSPAAERLLGPVPLLGECRTGAWKGEVDYTYDGGAAAGAWTGAFQLTDAVFELAGLAEPVELDSARVAIREDGVVVDRMRGRAGSVEFAGEYRRAAAADAVPQLRLNIPKLDSAELEKLFLPALRRDESLFARALRLGRSRRVPDWLAGRRADAAVEIGALALGEAGLEGVKARVRWDGPALEASDLSARFGDGSVAGRLTANLRRSLPSYRLNGRFRNVRWSGGRWDGRGTLQTSGTGPDLLRNLRFDGAFKGHSLALGADAGEATAISGSCVFTMTTGLPSLVFSDLAMTVGEASYKGQGSTGPDGRVHLDFTDGQRSLRLTGTLSPLALVR
jgi:hypothetical protein